MFFSVGQSIPLLMKKKIICWLHYPEVHDSSYYLLLLDVTHIAQQVLKPVYFYTETIGGHVV